MTRLCFIDTETTSLRPDRRAWEIGFIVRDPEAGVHDAEHHWFIHRTDLDLGNADPFALKVGRFYERHPDYGDMTQREEYALREVEKLTRGAHLVGAVPNFDAEVLAARMRAHGILPSWHYHLICVENLAIGYINGRCHREGTDREWSNALADVGMPWKSDELSAALGVKVSGEDRHTALGDARWAMAIYDAVTGGAS